MDLKERFDQALEGGPTHWPIEDRLVAGRRATRRRRTAMGAAALATVTIVGGIAWAGPGTENAVDRGRIADRTGTSTSTPRSTTSPTPTSTSTSPTASRGPRANELPILNYDLNSGYLTPFLSEDPRSGELTTAAGFVIERYLENPVKRDGVLSTAAELTARGELWWAMAAVLPGRSSWTAETPAITNRTFEQWVHELTVLNADQMFVNGEHVPGWVTLGEDGLLTAHKGATIIEQAVPGRTDQGAQKGSRPIALIEVDGARLCAMAGSLPDDPDFFYAPESQYQGCSGAFPGIDHPGHPESQAP